MHVQHYHFLICLVTCADTLYLPVMFQLLLAAGLAVSSVHAIQPLCPIPGHIAYGQYTTAYGCAFNDALVAKKRVWCVAFWPRCRRYICAHCSDPHAINLHHQPPPYVPYPANHNPWNYHNPWNPAHVPWTNTPTYFNAASSFPPTTMSPYGSLGTQSPYPYYPRSSSSSAFAFLTVMWILQIMINLM